MDGAEIALCTPGELRDLASVYMVWRGWAEEAERYEEFDDGAAVGEDMTEEFEEWQRRQASS